MTSQHDSTARVRARALARESKLDWSAVQAAYTEERALARETHERENAIRVWAWRRMTSAGCWPFWRIGFPRLWERVLRRGGDHDQVRGFDVLVAGALLEFPELASRSDPADWLWGFLTAPYQPLPTADTLWPRALARVAQQAVPVHNPSLAALEY